MLTDIDKLFSNQDFQGFFKLKTSLAKHIAKTINLNEDEVFGLLEMPKSKDHGHLSFPVFSFSGKYKSSPQKLALQWMENLKEDLGDLVKEVKVVSGFINFSFKEACISQATENFLTDKELARFKQKSKERLVIDFGSPNVAKHMNVGHLRAVAQGQALVNLARKFDYEVISLNHLGDWGTQFGKLLWAYDKWSEDYDLSQQPVDTLVKLYVRFHEEAQKNPDYHKEAALLFQKLEKGDARLEKLWKEFVDISLKEYEATFAELNIKHDLVLGESFYKDHIKALHDRLKDKNLLEESEGAEVVFVNKDLPPCLIQKTDGASTYAARDLCSAIYRFEKLKVSKNIYITGSDQILHFKQVFQVLEKLEPSWHGKNYHVYFGMYLFKDKAKDSFGKMSTRQGNVVLLKDILKSAEDRVEDILNKRRPELKNKKQIAKQVGIGAVLFHDLSSDRVKDVDFNWNQILDFEGRTGIFVQYSHVRCLSLIAKYNKKINLKFKDPLTQENSIALMWTLLQFETVLLSSLKFLKPHILASYLLDLSHEFNRFYSNQRILEAKNADDLMILVSGVQRILNEGLKILNIPAPSEM